MKKLDCPLCGQPTYSPLTEELEESIQKREVKKKEIAEWFKMICKGIRSEYEQGASLRELEIDGKTLERMLKEI